MRSPPPGRATATVKATEATLKVDEANILRLETLQAFQKVTAPFDGVITARTVDPGALVQADTPTTTREMFHLMRTDTVRVWVNVPQTFSTAIQRRAGRDRVPAATTRPTRSPVGWPGRPTPWTRTPAPCSPRSTSRTRTTPCGRGCTCR